MATIDKSLPNTKTEIEIPGEEEIVETQEEIVERQEGGETEIEMTEDGGATVNFDPSAATPEGGEDHDANLADFLDDKVLDPLSSELMDQYNSYNITTEQFRRIARTDPWRSIWNVGKKQGALFNKPSCELTKDQLSLSSYSTLYDNVYESHKCPNDKIIEDDDCLDGWLIEQRRENEKDRKQQEVDSMIKNPKIANSQEIFVMAKDKKSAQDIYDLNDPMARNTIKSRDQQIRSAGQVKFTDLKDVRQDIATQSHQTAIKSIKGRAK